MNKFISCILVSTGLALSSVSANAISIYQVGNTSAVNCNNAPHGLWTNNDINTGSCSNYFSIDGIFTIFDDSANTDDWTATLVASALNPQGVNASINLSFDDFADTHKYKKEGGTSDTSGIDFFTSISGTIEILGTSYDIDHYAGGYALQYGLGANAKNPNEFGGSAWIRSCQGGSAGTGLACMSSHHWDLNLTFTPVSEPGTLALLGLGLAGLGLTRRKASK